MKTTEQQHNERKQELMENALSAMPKTALQARELKLWQKPAAAQKQIYIHISKILTSLLLSLPLTV